MSKFQPHATHDPDADAIYVYLTDSQVARSQPLDDLRIIDFSADGGVIGVEFVGVSGGIDLSDLPFPEKVEELINELNLGIKIFA
jgi:uncharacterized protein YuzE